MELQHFSHDHPLILKDQAKDVDSGIVCYGCLRPISGYTYECRQCDFVLHKSCAELPSKIIHFFHPQHPLTLLSKSPYGQRKCDHCDESVWGFMYHCSICEYDLDIKCVQLGQIVNHEGHQHSFMVFNLPSTFLTVVLEDLQESRDAALGEEQAVSLITSDVNKISLEENDMLSTIQHFSHPCQLILTNDDEPQNAKICDGCVRPISAPFYQCASCGFFLHPRCAELPTTIRSILHPHPLTLLVQSSTYTVGLFKCSTCLKVCNGFIYECRLCGFLIDARCASISKKTLKHDGHEHILSLVQKMSRSNCSACGGMCAIKFRCEDCDFNLDLRCALLPLTVTHEWHEKHPFKLTFVNVEHISEFYFCDLCEEVRNTDDWYYCCKECDISAHTSCVLGKHDVKFGVMYYWEKLHDHNLKLVAEKSKNSYGCKSECDTDNKDVVMECPTCDYHTHLNLVGFIDSILADLRTSKRVIGESFNDWQYK